jgi:trehalose-phosphatase
MAAAAAIPMNLGSGAPSEAPEIWDSLCSALVTYGRLHIFADFDGTLSNLVEVPNLATLDPRAEGALRRLHHNPRVSLCIVSGRSVDDVASRIPLPVTFAGDHGIEIHAPDMEYIVPEAQVLRRTLLEMCNHIRQEVQGIPGALVEAKRFTASVHYRQVDSQAVPAILAAIRECLVDTQFDVRNGKCVFEIYPRVDWGKGDAVSWLLHRQSASPEQAVCIGDDETDEHMFRKHPDAVNVRVIDRPGISTAARYCIHRNGVASLLNGIADIAEAITWPCGSRAGLESIPA